jgi:hypothetical protein
MAKGDDLFSDFYSWIDWPFGFFDLPTDRPAAADVTSLNGCGNWLPLQHQPENKQNELVPSVGGPTSVSHTFHRQYPAIIVKNSNSSNEFFFKKKPKH